MTLSRFLNIKILAILLGVVVATGITLVNVKSYIGRQNAEQLLNSMYSFNKIEDLKDRQKDIKKLVTEDAYEFVSLNNMEHSLQAYLKMKGNPSRVKIDTITDDYVIYELECKAITPGRTFMLMYDTNLFGKLDSIREAEVVDFY